MATIDDFVKLELVVGVVREAMRVEGSSKLLRLMIDLGETEIGGEGTAPISKLRQIISGIAKYYQPEDLIGKQVVVIANLEPRMMMGLESRGMVLAAHGENGPVILDPSGSVPAGARVS